MAAFLEFRTQEIASDEFLDKHADLRDLLEPMLGSASADEGLTDTSIGETFVIERELGRGGMGVVYAARHIQLGRRVAVKVLPKDLTLQPASIARFRREAKTIATLDHPGIVKVLAIGEDDDKHWFAMELIDGSTLEQHIGELRGRHESPSRSTASMLDLAIEVADALHHAHGFGIVHRDVKPSNVMLKRDSGAVLTDFGLARDARDPGLTAPGGRAGTPCYMAPEQIRGHASAGDVRSDVFALGVTLYEMLTFRRAFDASTTDLVIARVLREEPEDPRRANPSVSGDLAAVVAKSIEKDPARRYATAGEFAEELRACRANRPVRARKQTVFLRATRWSRRHPARAGLALALALGVPLLAGGIGYIIASVPLVRAGEQRELDELIEQGLHLVFHSDRDQDRARQVIEEAMARAPEHPEVRIAAAVMRSRWVNHAAALALLEERPDLLDAHRELQRARALYLWAAGRVAEADAVETQLGEPRSAFEFFFAGFVAWRRSQAVGGDAGPALRLLSLASRTSDRPRLGFVLTLAEVADAVGSAAVREEAVTTLVTVWPDSSRAWGMAAWVLRDADPKRALHAVDRALALYPDEPGLLRYRSRILRNLGEIDAAMAELERALARKPEFLEARTELEELRRRPR